MSEATNNSIELYHFTRPEYLSSILRHGVDTGEIALNLKEAINAVCLTADGDPTAQSGWTYVVPEKASRRLRIVFDRSDPLLIKWKFFKDKFRMESKWFRILTLSGGGNVYQWFVYTGVIPAENIVEIWDCDNGHALTSDEIRESRSLPEVRGVNLLPFRRLSIQEALRRPLT